MLLLALWGYASYLWYAWTKPEVIQQLLIAQLQEQFQDVEVEVESAQLRLFGGIAVRNLRMVRHRGEMHEAFLIIPYAKIMHDKEQLAKKRLSIRKIEVQDATIRLERLADGHFNVDGLFQSKSDSAAIPTFVFRNTTIQLIDRMIDDRPIGRLLAEQMTVMNDPGTVVDFQGLGNLSPFGPIRFTGRVHRLTNQTSLKVELPRISLDEAMSEFVKRYRPEWNSTLEHIHGMLRVELTIENSVADPQTFYHRARTELTNGRITLPMLPLPLDEVEMVATCHNGQLTIERAEARAGDARISGILELLPITIGEDLLQTPVSFTSVDAFPKELENRIRRLEVNIDHLQLNDHLFARMPEPLRKMQRMFSPSGPVSLSMLLTREAEQVVKRCIVKPQGLTAAYEKFRYPLHQLRGTLDFVMSETVGERLDIDLTGTASDRRITIKGFASEHRGKSNVEIRINGNDVPLNETLIAALPPKSGRFVRELNATTNGDFQATIYQIPGTHLLAKEFRVQLRNGQMCFAHFPLPLEQINGTIVIIPTPNDIREMDGPEKDLSAGDVLELRGITARHGNALLSLNGRKGPSPAGSTLTMTITGDRIPLDGKFHEAMRGLKLDQVWAQLHPSGFMNCSLTVHLHERPKSQPTLDEPVSQLPELTQGMPFDPINDLELVATVRGGTIQPEFFPYRLDDVAGRMEYARGKFDLIGTRARHGSTLVDLEKGEVRLRPDGGIWSDLRNLSITPTQMDDDLLMALPVGMRKGVRELNFQGPIDIGFSRLVVDDPAAPAPNPANPATLTSHRQLPNDPPPTIYWDGSIQLRGNSLRIGSTWDRVVGKIASRGVFEGNRFGRVIANVQLDHAHIAKIPTTVSHGRLEIDPRQPDIVQIPWFQAKVYGGEIGGDARLDISRPDPLFDIKLNATRVDLEQIAKAYQLGPNAHLEGLATAQLFLSNRDQHGQPVNMIYGGGSFDVPAGKILNLPKMLDLFKLLNLRVPDQTAFEEVHAQFDIRGDRIRFSQLDLMGNAISLGGEGTIQLDSGATNLEFYTIWSRWLKGWLQTPVGELAAEISSMLFKIEVRGNFNGNIDFRKVTVPLVVDPVRKVVERMRHTQVYQRMGGVDSGN